MSDPPGEAEALIEKLGLKRHPEGGWYGETFRAPAAPGERAASTAIYFLLRRGECSHWHRLHTADEVWHHYAGAPLELRIAAPGDPPHARTLGPAIFAGQTPQIVVPAGAWQSARSLGDWTLVGCTVAPAFEFADFELAPPGWSPGR